MSESTEAAKHGTAWLVAVIVALFVAGGIAVGWQSTFGPLFMQNDREINQNSHQYVEAQRSFMLQKLSAIQELEAEITELDPAADADTIAAKQAQVEAFTTELEERSQLIDESEIPASVADYLASQETK